MATPLTRHHRIPAAARVAGTAIRHACGRSGHPVAYGDNPRTPGRLDGCGLAHFPPLVGTDHGEYHAVLVDLLAGDVGVAAELVDVQQHLDPARSGVGHRAVTGHLGPDHRLALDGDVLEGRGGLRVLL